jgi:excinuclease ABC subunit C
MDLSFTVIPYTGTLPEAPRGSAVYKIFDTHGQLIVLDKTSNLAQRLDRFFGPRSELLKDLDLREITSRIEFRRTWSPFETTYVLYLERRRLFPKTYRRMRTFRLFPLMKISRKQRFPRIYASRQIKAGVDYFGPFVSRGQFTRLKTTLERAFKLRPCLYNIRGNDPHPDCMYFQMHTCSRPCNNDIDRAGYLADVDAAIAFIQGSDEKLASEMMSQIASLSSDEKFEEAELLRRRIEKIRNARHDVKDTFASVWTFDYLAVLPSDSTARTRIAFIRAGNIVGIEDYEVASLNDTLPGEVHRIYSGALPKSNREWQYDEFCLVAGFLVDPLKSVDLVPPSKSADVQRRIQARLKEKKKSPASVSNDN